MMELSFGIFGIFFVIVALMTLVGTLFHFGLVALIFKKALESPRRGTGRSESDGEEQGSGEPAARSDPRCPSCGASDPEAVAAPLSGDVRCRYCGSRYNLFSSRSG